MARPPLVLVIAFATGPSLAACGSLPDAAVSPPAVVVLAQAPSPLLKPGTELYLLALDETGDRQDTGHFSAPAQGDARPSPPANNPSALATEFAAALVHRAADRGIRIVNDTGGVQGRLLLWPRVTSSGGGADDQLDLRIRVWITTAEGAPLDEIAVRHAATGEPAVALAEAGRRTAVLVADYLAERRLARGGDAGATCPGKEAPPSPAPPPPPEPILPFEPFWTAWTASHGAAACKDAASALERDSDCAGRACRATLVLSSGYWKGCQIDAEERIALHRQRRRWEKQTAGTKPSPCLQETLRALQDPAAAAALPDRCAGEGKTEAALRAAVKRPAP